MSRFIFHNSRIRIHNTSYKNPAFGRVFFIADRDDQQFLERHPSPFAAQRYIVEISYSDIELFQAQLLKQGLAPKTVNDIFTIVRGIWADAFGDGILKSNLLDRINNVGSDADSEHTDPFT